MKNYLLLLLAAALSLLVLSTFVLAMEEEKTSKKRPPPYDQINSQAGKRVRAAEPRLLDREELLDSLKMPINKNRAPCFRSNDKTVMCFLESKSGSFCCWYDKFLETLPKDEQTSVKEFDEIYGTFYPDSIDMRNRHSAQMLYYFAHYDVNDLKEAMKGLDTFFKKEPPSKGDIKSLKTKFSILTKDKAIHSRILNCLLWADTNEEVKFLKSEQVGLPSITTTTTTVTSSPSSETQLEIEEIPMPEVNLLHDAELTYTFWDEESPCLFSDELLKRLQDKEYNIFDQDLSHFDL
jgi:hypothetical protein